MSHCVIVGVVGLFFAVVTGVELPGTCANDATCAETLRPILPDTCSWSPTVRLSKSSQRRHPHGLCWVSQEKRYVYLNIAKVASTSLKRLTSGPSGGRALQSKCDIASDGTITSFRPSLGRGEYGEAVNATGFFVFGFVRDPVRRFLSGFHTVAKRGAAGGAYGDSKRMPFVRVVHDEHAQMEAFFHDVAKNSGPWEEHTAPQTHYLSHPQSRTPVKMDFVGRVEQLEDGWRQIENSIGLSSVPSLPRRNAAERSTVVPNPVSLEELQNDDDMLLKVCRLYAQDFSCLNYSLPRVCLETTDR